MSYPAFNPAPGRPPPYLAGRAPEQQYLLSGLASLRARNLLQRELVFMAPRGNGKTALLRWFESVCGQGEYGVDIVWLTPDDIPDIDTLATRCAPPRRWWQVLSDELELDIAGGARLRWQLDNDPGILTELLIARCHKRPLALLLDEAHTLDLQVGRSLLNASQKIGAQAPFLLVLAGTPGLEYRLNEMNATFWSRAQKVGLERLDTASARVVLVKPFAEAGIDMEEVALDAVVNESQGYPFFLQCWGQALTGALREREAAGGVRRRIDGALVEQARPVFEEERYGHYEILRGQIQAAGLQPLAAAVTRAFGTAEMLEEDQLDAAICAALQLSDTEGHEQRMALAGFGYVWKPPGVVAVWYAGIPSLMQHVWEVEEKKALRRAAALESPPPAPAS